MLSKAFVEEHSVPHKNYRGDKIMKKYLKFVSVMLVISMLLIQTVAYANNSAASEIQASGTKILNAILWFGYAISLAMIIFIGIKYMLGAADAKANMKSTLVSWVVGALIVFMATTIAYWALQLARGDQTDTKAEGIADKIVQSLGNI